MDLYNEISFTTSKLITKKYSTSFSIAVSRLPIEMRQAIYSIYGFVRLADEIVDTFHDADQEFLLDDFEKEYYKTLEQGISMNPVLQSFAITVTKYQLPDELVDSFLKSMRADLNKQVYKTNQELDAYIHGSANVVGLMCLLIFLDGDKQRYNELKESAMKLGSAFQKVNFLRDLKEDTKELNRLYFPDVDTDNFTEEVKDELIEDIENDFDEAEKGIRELPGKSKLAVYIAFVYYKKLLQNLKQTPADMIMKTRIRVPNGMKFILLGKAYMKYNLKMI
ncbi:MAG TPA: phytoene/squalene synthase family protein [Dysgonamonadaceae bacterium]|nr:phytoene/squalene synthase family protein [Dysgonamonadaceae bacterium]